MQQNHQEVKGHFSLLIVGKQSYRFPTDMQAMECAEEMPDCVNWTVRLQNNKGLIESQKFRAAGKTNGSFTQAGR